MDNNKLSTDLGKASFSSHLNTTKHQKRNTTSEEGEISVFGAERYYNMKLEDDQVPNKSIFQSDVIKHVIQKEDQNQVLLDHMQHMKPKNKPRSTGIRSGTPSVSSESSWNSQTALLPTFQRNPSHQVHNQNKVKGRHLLARFSCNGSCSDKKSINVYSKKETIQKQKKSPVISEPKKKTQQRIMVKEQKYGTPTRNYSREHFEIPVLNSKIQNLRKSPDPDHVFLSWDAIPKAKKSFDRSTSCYEVDMESDASSDLFEIENLAGVSRFDEMKKMERNARKSKEEIKSSGCKIYKAVTVSETVAYRTDDDDHVKARSGSSRNHHNLDSAMMQSKAALIV